MTIAPHPLPNLAPPIGCCPDEQRGCPHPDLPTDAEIDESNRRAEQRRAEYRVASENPLDRLEGIAL